MKYPLVHESKKVEKDVFLFFSFFLLVRIYGEEEFEFIFILGELGNIMCIVDKKHCNFNNLKIFTQV